MAALSATAVGVSLRTDADRGSWQEKWWPRNGTDVAVSFRWRLEVGRVFQKLKPDCKVRTQVMNLGGAAAVLGPTGDSCNNTSSMQRYASTFYDQEFSDRWGIHHEKSTNIQSDTH